MSILETILKAQSGGLVKQVAGSLNLPEGQAGAAIAQLLPALTQGLKQNVQKPSGLESLLGALQGGNHERYVEQPERLASQETLSDGNSLLGRLLGANVLAGFLDKDNDSSAVDNLLGMAKKLF